MLVIYVNNYLNDHFVRTFHKLYGKAGVEPNDDLEIKTI